MASDDSEPQQMSSIPPILPQWPLCFEMARAIVTELGLDYYTATPSNLTLTEVLHLLLTKVRFGTGMPKNIKGSPWKLEHGSIRKNVNAILEHSMKTQMGKIQHVACLLYTSPSPRDRQKSRMPSSA